MQRARSLSAASGLSRLYSSASTKAAEDRELVVDILQANATKRDAKSYLARFRPSRPPASADRSQHVQYGRVNLGPLYAPGRAIADTPQFVRSLVPSPSGIPSHASLSVALVFLRDPEALDDDTLDGLAVTLGQLVKLDMHIALVLDMHHNHNNDSSTIDQLQRVSRAVSRHSPNGARVVTDCLGTDEAGEVVVALPVLLDTPLSRGLVPVIPTTACSQMGRRTEVDASDVMVALSQHFSFDLDSPDHPASLDRVILFDPLGGIPSRARGDGSHVFINLEQEFEEVDTELAGYASLADYASAEKKKVDYVQHQNNLRMVQRCLASLPSSSSALIVSPLQVADSARERKTAIIGTRRTKNTLIHNLLTNKPMVSSSLPTARLVPEDSLASQAPTLVKRGMPLTIVPQPSPHGWDKPTPLALDTDPRIDFARLVHLIEDSFRRKLDVEHYLNRIRDQLAGVIVAGAYEGAAILTWELPPGVTDPSRMVPYLDKFAVLQSSQGSAGVADILYQAMVRSAFPHGLCWRSRSNNVVNKWYLERATGSWKLPGGKWTMFWTFEDVSDEAFHDMVAVCSNIPPSLV